MLRCVLLPPPAPQSSAGISISDDASGEDFFSDEVIELSEGEGGERSTTGDDSDNFF